MQNLGLKKFACLDGYHSLIKVENKENVVVSYLPCFLLPSFLLLYHRSPTELNTECRELRCGPQAQLPVTTISNYPLNAWTVLKRSGNLGYHD